jgi:hypothetical protein
MNDILIENIKLKSDLQYDILFESKEYHSLDSGIKTFMKECYDMGVNTSIYIQQDKVLLESVDEGFFDRVKAGVVRTGQGIKNLSGFGTQTADSKDAGVDSLLNGFKQKFEKAKQFSGQGSPGVGPGVEGLKDKLKDDIEYIDRKTIQDKTPPPDQKTAEEIVIRTPGVPKSLKDKIIQGIRENPGKIKFLLAALSFGAGIAAATASANPLVGKAAGAAINGIGNGILAKIQGRGTGDAVMSGLTQGVAGAALAGAGTATVNAISSYIDQAGEVSPNAFQVTKQKSVPTPPTLPRTPDDMEPIGPEPIRADPTPSQTPTPSQSTTPTPTPTPTPSSVSPKYVEPGTRAARVAYDADQQAQYYKSRGYTGPKDTLGRPKALFRENKESMFVKSYNNTYTLKKSLNENIEEKWNEGYEETIDEALNAQQQQAYDEFLTDLGKMFNKPKDGVVAFMQSQGDRFKNVLDYLNQNVTPTAAPQQPTPDQPVQQPQGQVKPSLVKHINGIKQNQLFAGDLAVRIQNIVDAKPSGQLNDRSPMLKLRVFLKSINNVLNTNSANFRKQIGDPSTLLQQVNEDIKEYSDLAKQISAVMPSIIGATFELRQMFGVRKPQSPGGSAAGAVSPQISEEKIDNSSSLSVEELTRVKFFLSKLVDIGLLVKSIDVNSGDKVQLKNLYKNLLQLANIIVNKNVKGVKLNKKIDSAFQGKDILGDLPVNQKSSSVKKGPGDMFKNTKNPDEKLKTLTPTIQKPYDYEPGELE